ncbi:MAG TPA: GNAT family protein [Herpetosiphonaceae bacterium]
MTTHPHTLEPVTLEGQYVRLEPLVLAHLDQLCEVALDEDLWRWTTSVVQTRDDLRAYIEAALHGQDQSTMLPFATVEKASGRAIGSTRYGNIELRDRRVEIGWTWVGRPWQRTPINTEAKYLMLRYAFETLGCMRVELKTDALNERSRRAIARIGAQEEGTLRKHMLTYSGRIRDTVYFSIIDSEWPDVKAALEAKLAR